MAIIHVNVDNPRNSTSVRSTLGASIVSGTLALMAERQSARMRWTREYVKLSAQISLKISNEDKSTNSL